MTDLVFYEYQFFRRSTSSAKNMLCYLNFFNVRELRLKEKHLTGFFSSFCSSKGLTILHGNFEIQPIKNEYYSTPRCTSYIIFYNTSKFQRNFEEQFVLICLCLPVSVVDSHVLRLESANLCFIFVHHFRCISLKIVSPFQKF